MKKKLKDLTDEEIKNICIKQRIKHRPNCACENQNLITCPLWNGECMRGFIQKLRFVNREVDL